MLKTCSTFHSTHLLIIPAIDIRGGRCVRLLQGNYDKETVYSNEPVTEALHWQKQGAKFLHIVDLDGAKEGKPANIKIVKSIVKAINIPSEFGGGIRTLKDAEEALEAGVSRIILGTAACENPSFVRNLINLLGKEKVVIGLDAKDGKASVRGWLKNTTFNVLELALRFSESGVMRFIYTDISVDGMLSGPNFESVATFCDKVPDCKVIASGGIASASDIKKLTGLAKNNLEGVIVGKALYDGHVKLSELIAAAG